MKTEKKALVILKGTAPGLNLLEHLWKISDQVICADGAASVLYEYGKVPDVIIGDFDSIPQHLLEEFKSVKQVKLDDQDTTDGEKALHLCVEQDLKQVSMIGAFGGRLDHQLYNIELLKKMNRFDLSITCYSEKEKVFLAENSFQFEEKPGSRVSFFPVFGAVSNVSTKGLKYELNCVTLEFGRFSSISNQISGTSANISFPNGCLLMVIEHNLV